MMKKLFLLLFFVTLTISAQKKLEFEFDYAQFGYDSASNFVEFYYSFNQATMTISKSDDGSLSVDGILKITIEDSLSGEKIINNQWRVSNSIQESNLNVNQSLIGVLSFVLPKGTVICEISGVDLNNQENSKLIKDFIKIKPFHNGAVSLSDIQLAYKMIQGSENTSSIFYKNTYEVVPVPNLVFGKEQPVLFFYVEAYQPEAVQNSENYKLNQMIFNSRGNLVMTKDKYLGKNFESRVEVGSFVIANFPTDTYTLVLSLIDSVNNSGVSSSKKFFVINPDVFYEDTTTAGNLSLLGTTFGSMSEEELDDLFEKAKFISISQEIDRYEKIRSLDGKIQFMNEFWQARDQIAETSRNEFYHDYVQRVETANQRYTAVSRKGWKTDRGRVYLMFGEPTEIDRYPSQTETRPYEIWQYTDIEGGVVFVFADIQGFSDYTLVHSTKRGEMRDDNWTRRIYIR